MYVLTPILLFLTLVCFAILLFVGPFTSVIKTANFLFSAADITTGNKVFSGEIDQSLFSHRYSEIPSDAQVVYPYYGDGYATLYSPEVDIACQVYWGDSMEILRKGAGQYCGSSPLGVEGNSVICAHVSKHFKNLKNLKLNDTVVLTTEYGRFTYAVRESVIFDENDLTYILPTEEDILTLYTCHNYILGPTPERLAVICDLTEAIYFAKES